MASETGHHTMSRCLSYGADARDRDTSGGQNGGTAGVDAVSRRDDGAGHLGDLTAVVVGLGLADGVGAFPNVPFITSPSIILVAFFFSTLIGMVFGYFPAKRTAHLKPIDALPHE
jgi:hypothetical protein